MKKKSFKQVKENFLKKSPSNYNKKALEALLFHVFNNHKKEKKQLFFSKLNSKINSDDDWYSLFAELHVFYKLTKELRFEGYFSKQEENDICLVVKNKEIFVEVKAIVPNSFQRDYDNFFENIRNIPTGKKISIKTKKYQKNRKKIFEKIKEIILKLESNHIDDELEIRILGEGKSKNKTSLIAPTIAFFPDKEGLKRLIMEKLEDKSNQISRADVVYFYSFHNVFDEEDFYEVIKNFSEEKKELNLFDNKKFICFTHWSSFPLALFFKEKDDWNLICDPREIKENLIKSINNLEL